MTKNRSVGFRAIEELIHTQTIHAQLTRRFVRDELLELLEQDKQKFDLLEVSFYDL